MYKAVLTHEIMPGKLPDVIEWLKEGDKKAREKNPDATLPTRYITVYGSVNQIVIEVENEEIPAIVYAQATHNSDLLPLIVPGRTEMRLLKKIDI